MRINNLSFPHPVLGNADDVGGVFKTTLDVSLKEDCVELNLNHHLSNRTIEKLVLEERALFNTEILCPQTLYRESFTTGKKEVAISIPSTRLRNRVDLNFFITAATDITDYSVSESNADYRGYKFDVAKGDVIAYGGKCSFLAAKDWGALSTIKSFMDIDQYDSETGPVEVSLTDSKVVILLSKNDYANYRNCKGNRNLYSLFHSAIVLPALVYVLQNMGDGGGHQGADWYQNLDSRLSDGEEFKNLDRTEPQDVIRIAQLLLKNPISRMLLDTDKLTEVASQDES